MALKNRTAIHPPLKRSRKHSANTTPKSLDASYNQYKTFPGQQYTGMAIGRTHSWNYDSGKWKEKKLTPDTWKISYDVVKRRAGHAPEGSGAPVGTEYHWYILADQYARKLDANDYETRMSGYKFKIAHKRADHDKWNITKRTQRKKLIKILRDMALQLEEEDDEPGSEHE